MRALVQRRQRRALRRDRRARGRRSSATRSASRPSRCPRSGWSATPVRRRCRELSTLLDAGKIPVVAPLAAGPLNVNADDAAAALAIGLGADRLFPHRRRRADPRGEVVDPIDVDAAEELLASGTLEGGIIPKLGAAVTAARGGVTGRTIGRTAVAGMSVLTGTPLLPTYARFPVTFVDGEGRG